MGNRNNLRDEWNPEKAPDLIMMREYREFARNLDSQYPDEFLSNDFIEQKWIEHTQNKEKSDSPVP